MQDLLCYQFQIFIPAEIDSIEQCIDYWVNNTSRSSPLFFLPHYSIWAIWKARNMVIFEGKNSTVCGVLHQILYAAQLSYSRPVMKNRLSKTTRQIGNKPRMIFPCGFFDGALSSSTAGIGYCLFFNENHHLDCSLGVGYGSNTKAELLGLWALLFTSQMMGVPLPHIYGDSQVIINWAKGLSALTPPDLHHWCRETKKLILSFPGLSLSHIYREHNRIADGLSKTALTLSPGIGCFSEFIDDLLVTSDSFQLF